MKRNGRARDGAAAKRRRIRIQRRLAAATVEAMRAVSPRFRVTLGGWDRLRRQFKVNIVPLREHFGRIASDQTRRWWFATGLRGTCEACGGEDHPLFAKPSDMRRVCIRCTETN